MLGEGIDVCSIEELHQLENQLERGLTRIRAKKVPLSTNTDRIISHAKCLVNMQI